MDYIIMLCIVMIILTQILFFVKGKNMIKIACVGDNVVDIHYDKKCCYPGGNAMHV